MNAPPFLAVQRAEFEWDLGVQDKANTEHFDRIQAYITDGVGDRVKYTRNGKYQWCGAFAAWCYLGDNNVAGLHQQLLEALFQSTYRLWLYAHYRTDANIWPFGRVSVAGAPPVPVADWHGDEHRLVCVDPAKRLTFVPDAGDIACVNRSKRGPWGKHIVLVVGYDSEKKTLQTIEGNARGRAPSGAKWEGVVRNDRSLASTAFIVRPSPKDFLGDLEFVK